MIFFVLNVSFGQDIFVHEHELLLIYYIFISVSTVASSDPIVSTDGLGSSLDGSASISSFEEQPYRPVFAKNLGMFNFTAHKKILILRSYIDLFFKCNSE